MIMKSTSSPENQVLVLERFNGIEIYPVELAQWHLYRDNENSMMNLWIALSAGQAIKQQKDTKSLCAEPNWELNLVDQSLAEELIKPGFTAIIPEAYDESRCGWVTNFYYCEHEGTNKNIIEAIEVDGDRVRFRILGETVDVNYYDGSKSPTKLSADAWFERNRDGERSMS
jgi:hypothetical protein